jgi:hypothetical protein
MLGFPRSTVYDVYNRWKSSGESKRKAHKKRSDSKRTPRFLMGLKRSIAKNPATPITVLAKKRSVDRMTVSKAIKNDLNLKSYKFTKRHILTSAMKVRRLENGTKLLSNLKSNGNRIVFFSDEKNWTVDRAYNTQNDRFLAEDKVKVPHIYRTKFPASIMTLGVIGSNGKVMPPIFFEPKERVGADKYCEVLSTKVIPWMKANSDGKKFIFQQDSAPAHTAKKTLNLLQAQNVEFWDPKTWPSNSPDLNPMDFFF